MVKFGIPYDGMVLHTMRNKYNKDRINTYIRVRELAYYTYVPLKHYCMYAENLLISFLTIALA